MDSKPTAGAPAPTQPAPASVPLTQIYCSMAKADWLQIGDAVTNPYLGQQMSDCGEVRAKVPAPAAGSALATFVTAYLDIERAMNADKLNASAVAALKAASDQLPDDKYSRLKRAAGKLSDAKDLTSARAAFKPLSNDLVKLLHP